MSEHTMIKGTSAHALNWYAKELLKRIAIADFFDDNTTPPSRVVLAAERIKDAERTGLKKSLPTDKLEIANKSELTELNILKFTFPETFSKLYFDDMHILEKDAVKAELRIALNVVIDVTRDFV
jgi:hypothetical protein